MCLLLLIVVEKWLRLIEKATTTVVTEYFPKPRCSSCECDLEASSLFMNGLSAWLSAGGITAEGLDMRPEQFRVRFYG